MRFMGDSIAYRCVTPYTVVFKTQKKRHSSLAHIASSHYQENRSEFLRPKYWVVLNESSLVKIWTLVKSNLLTGDASGFDELTLRSCRLTETEEDFSYVD